MLCFLPVFLHECGNTITISLSTSQPNFQNNTCIYYNSVQVQYSYILTLYHWYCKLQYLSLLKLSQFFLALVKQRVQTVMFIFILQLYFVILSGVEQTSYFSAKRITMTTNQQQQISEKLVKLSWTLQRYCTIYCTSECDVITVV